MGATPDEDAAATVERVGNGLSISDGLEREPGWDLARVMRDSSGAMPRAITATAKIAMTQRILSCRTSLPLSGPIGLLLRTG